VRKRQRRRERERERGRNRERERDIHSRVGEIIQTKSGDVFSLETDDTASSSVGK